MKSIGFRFMVAALAVTLGSAISRSQTADAAPPPSPSPSMHGHEFGHGEHMMGFSAKRLNLSEEQQTQMKTIMQKEDPTLKPLFQQLHQVHAQLKQYSEGAYDEAKVRTLATQESQTQVELTVQLTRVHNEMFQVLTPDQQAQEKEFEANREARMQKHMHDAPPASEQ
ncbi:MAG: Spy/CpxP family protein refolding chaperone [Candidatus Sulfotelmatobacter sp.]